MWCSGVACKTEKAYGRRHFSGAATLPPLFAIFRKHLSVAPFACPNCARLVHFEVRVCPNCSATLGFDPASDAFLFLADNATIWRGTTGETHDLVVCENNNEYEICNWLVPAGGEPRCRACRHNRTIPDLTVPTVPERWGRIEAAKRRLFHELIRLKLPIETPAEAEPFGRRGLVFDFLYDASAETAGQPKVMTGHDGGLITLNIIEADDVERERARRALNEPYRTLLGHFRHEIGHYYEERLVDGTDLADECRQVFGDERIDYAESMKKHYGEGANAWAGEFVSAYATMHPWEDFAETFAHNLHIIDALATLGGFGVRMDPLPGATAKPSVDFDPYKAPTRQLIDEWVPFSFAQNAINRSMGQPDLYPFHLSETIVGKLDYINRLVHEARGARPGEVPAADAVAAETVAA